MAVPGVAMRLCLGDHAVPLREETVLFCDLHNVCDNLADGKVAWHLLDLSVGRRPYAMAWLERACGLPYYWWQTHGRKLPVVQEALEAIEAGRIRKGPKRRYPKQPNIIVAIKLRGAVFFVKNTTQCLTIAFQKKDEDGHVSQLLDLMKMLQPDIDARRLQQLQLQKKKHVPREPQEPRDHPEPQEEGRAAPQQADDADPEAQADDAEEPQDPQAPQDLEPVIRAALLTQLSERADCRSATWLPKSGRVRAKRALDGAEKFFTVKKLGKARRLEGLGYAGSIQVRFDEALEDIGKFLESDEPPAPVAPPAQPEDEAAGDLAGPHGPEAHRPSAGEAGSESSSDVDASSAEEVVQDEESLKDAESDEKDQAH